MEVLLEPLQFDFMVRALAVTVASAAVCAVLSCWLVLVGWSLMGDAVSHAVLPGVVLAYLLGAPFTLGALAFGLLAVVLIGLVRSTTPVKGDTAIGVVFTTLFALGLVLVSVTPSHVDLGHIVFGNVLGVSRTDVVQTLALAAVTLVVLLAVRRDLTLYAFDRVQAFALGLPVRFLGALLLVALAVTAVTALQTVGVILVVAMLVIPGATAYLLTERFDRMLVLSPTIAVTCAVTGLYVAYYLDTAPGGTVVLAQGTAFAAAYLLSPVHGILTGARKRRRTRLPSPR